MVVGRMTHRMSEAARTLRGSLSPAPPSSLNAPSVFLTRPRPLELRIKRQNSSDSISSLNSITSHSSIGKDADAKKKKKKSWVGEG